MKRSITILLAICLTPLGVAINSVAMNSVERSRRPDQDTNYWPTKEWRSSTPEQQGVDSAKLADALYAIRQHNINIHSLLLVRNGNVVLDAYFFPFEENSLPQEGR